MLKHAQEARENLLARMEPSSVAVFYSGKAPHKTLDQYYPYAPQRNFFYLTGLQEPNMILMLSKGEETTKTALYIEENTDLIIKWEGARMEKQTASAHSGIPEENIHFITNFKAHFNLTMNYARSPLGKPPKTLYLDLYHVNPDSQPIALSQAHFIVENYKELTLKNANEQLAYLRMFKTEEELAHIRKAISHTKKGLEAILSNLTAHEYEYQLAADFQHAITFDGSEGTAFDTIAASGKNATVLHYVANTDKLEKDTLILFDLGALHQNYAADISRTYPLSGTFTERQKVLYEIVLKVNKETIALAKPGVTWKELNTFSKDRLIEETKKIGLIKQDEQISDFYYHTIGHFLGLDVHDVGLYDYPLEAGMVLTIEPGLYIAEEQIGIRIEDDILITEKGAENLSADIIKETEDIEAFIKRAS